MPSLYQSYEQIYSVLTADITSKIGRLKSGDFGSDNVITLKEGIQAKFEEASDLLEQLELECRGMGSSAGARVAAYRAELERCRLEYQAACIMDKNYDIHDGDTYDDWTENDQRQKLLDNTERLERTGKNLSDSYRVVLETEQIGAAVLQDLSEQRETIQRSRSRLRETDEQLNRSSRVMNTMIMRALQDRVVLYAVFIILALLLVLGLYLYVT